MPSERKIYVTVRWIWIAACLSILLLGLGAYRIEPSDTGTELELLPFMLILSFPSGLLAAIFVPVLGISDPPIRYSIVWFWMFSLGYWQWFVFLPQLRNPRIISLGLLESNTSNPKPSLQAIPIGARPRTRPQRTRSRRAFDKNGLSPLQRAINKDSQSCKL
jgi:hypothetical protein